MARIRPLEYEEVEGALKAAYDEQIAAHGRMTNMKKTLGNSPVALHALMEFYPLYDEACSFLGERLAAIFTHAVSSETDCLICSSYFQRMLIEWGEDPEALELDDLGEAVVAFGRQLVKNSNKVSDELYERLAKRLEPARIVTLTALGGIMIATNVFNNALGVELDEYLVPYRADGAEETTPAADNGS